MASVHSLQEQRWTVCLPALKPQPRSIHHLSHSWSPLCFSIRAFENRQKMDRDPSKLSRRCFCSQSVGQKIFLSSNWIIFSQDREKPFFKIHLLLKDFIFHPLCPLKNASKAGDLSNTGKTIPVLNLPIPHPELEVTSLLLLLLNSCRSCGLVPLPWAGFFARTSHYKLTCPCSFLQVNLSQCLWFLKCNTAVWLQHSHFFPRTTGIKFLKEIQNTLGVHILSLYMTSIYRLLLLSWGS